MGLLLKRILGCAPISVACSSSMASAASAVSNHVETSSSAHKRSRWRRLASSWILCVEISSSSRSDSRTAGSSSSSAASAASRAACADAKTCWYLALKSLVAASVVGLGVRGRPGEAAPRCSRGDGTLGGGSLGGTGPMDGGCGLPGECGTVCGEDEPAAPIAAATLMPAERHWWWWWCSCCCCCCCCPSGRPVRLPPVKPARAAFAPSGGPKRGPFAPRGDAPSGGPNNGGFGALLLLGVASGGLCTLLLGIASGGLRDGSSMEDLAPQQPWPLAMAAAAAAPAAAAALASPALAAAFAVAAAALAAALVSSSRRAASPRNCRFRAMPPSGESTEPRRAAASMAAEGWRIAARRGPTRGWMHGAEHATARRSGSALFLAPTVTNIYAGE